MHEAQSAPRMRRAKSAKALIAKPNDKALVVRETPEEQFHKAYLEMAPKMPSISKTDKIVIRGAEIAFASYAVIRRATDAILSEHGFYIIHQGELLEGGTFVVRSYLRHRGGFFFPSELPVPIRPIPGSAMTEAQAIGNAMTYGRRYNTMALLNLLSEAPQDRDIDGAMLVKVKTITRKQEKELSQALKEHGVPFELFAEHYLKPHGLELLCQLPAKDFANALKACKGYTKPSTVVYPKPPIGDEPAKDESDA